MSPLETLSFVQALEEDHLDHVGDDHGLLRDESDPIPNRDGSMTASQNERENNATPLLQQPNEATPGHEGDNEPLMQQDADSAKEVEFLKSMRCLFRVLLHALVLVVGVWNWQTQLQSTKIPPRIDTVSSYFTISNKGIPNDNTVSHRFHVSVVSEQGVPRLENIRHLTAGLYHVLESRIEILDSVSDASIQDDQELMASFSTEPSFHVALKMPEFVRLEYLESAEEASPIFTLGTDMLLSADGRLSLAKLQDLVTAVTLLPKEIVGFRHKSDPEADDIGNRLVSNGAELANIVYNTVGNTVHLALQVPYISVTMTMADVTTMIDAKIDARSLVPGRVPGKLSIAKLVDILSSEWGFKARDLVPTLLVSEEKNGSGEMVPILCDDELTQQLANVGSGSTLLIVAKLNRYALDIEAAFLWNGLKRPYSRLTSRKILAYSNMDNIASWTLSNLLPGTYKAVLIVSSVSSAIHNLRIHLTDSIHIGASSIITMKVGDGTRLHIDEAVNVNQFSAGLIDDSKPENFYRVVTKEFAAGPDTLRVEGGSFFEIFDVHSVSLIFIRPH